jgi:hypothetical protein
MPPLVTWDYPPRVKQILIASSDSPLTPARATIIGTGLFAIGGTGGLAVAAPGLVPVATGSINLCPVAPLWGGHFPGAKYCAGK